MKRPSYVNATQNGGSNENPATTSKYKVYVHRCMIFVEKRKSYVKSYTSDEIQVNTYKFFFFIHINLECVHFYIGTSFVFEHAENSSFRL